MARFAAFGGLYFVLYFCLEVARCVSSSSGGLNDLAQRFQAFLTQYIESTNQIISPVDFWRAFPVSLRAARPWRATGCVGSVGSS